MRDYLAHHGIKGQRWGKRNGPPYPLEASYKDPKSMSDDMKTWKYTEYTKLQSPEKTEKKRSGSCHDQAIFEAEQLRRMGYQPKTVFFMEHDGQGNVGVTHTYVHYKDGGKEHWFENAWGGREGIRAFNNADEIMKEIDMAHRLGETGDPKRYPETDFTEFDWTKHKPGEDLQEYMDTCFKYWK